jgi:hypothetical protein
VTTRALRLIAVPLVLAAVAAAAATGARARRPAPTVAIFYYGWYGNPTHDGSYQWWTQNGHSPPADIYSAYFPARGVYSSSDPGVLAQQLADLRAAGATEVMVSWWGRGSSTDERLPALVAAAPRYGLTVAAHVEPYPGRSATSVADDVLYLTRLGIRDVYVYNAELIPAAAWALARTQMPPVRLFAQTPHVGFARAGGFDGVYTYDIVGYPGSMFARYCAEARRVGLLCAPSVGPGYTAFKADGDVRVKPRRDGATYDSMWAAAIRARPDLVTVTSYNEWGEGTQIEPAAPALGYESYDGAWGFHGGAAERAYLRRTAFWAARLRDGL